MQSTINSFSELVMKHAGKRICVMGGSPSLADDIKSVDADVWISVNEHGAKLREVDYVVAMDDIHTKLHVPMLKHIRPHTDAPIISPWHWGDFQLSHWHLIPKIPYSGVVASWCAYLMGGHPVILAGFDCYKGHGAAVGQHKEYVKHIKGEVRVVSGALTSLYPKYDANEKFAPFVIPDIMKLEPTLTDEIRVKVMKKVNVRGQDWQAGTLLTVTRHEVRRQLKHKSLIEV
jgi:hypothetical protein